MTSLDNWLSVRLQTKWLWVQIPLLSLEHDMVDGMHLELFTGLSWRQYPEEMSKSGTYGDEITLHAMANMLLVEIVVILTL